MTTGAVLNKQSQSKWITEIFGEGPPRSMRTLALECIDAGVFNQIDREAAFVEWATKTCHRTVRRLVTDDGLPLAGPTKRDTDDDAVIWAQRKLWGYDDYDLNVSEHVKQGMGHLTIAARLADECEERFGTRPEVPAV